MKDSLAEVLTNDTGLKIVRGRQAHDIKGQFEDLNYPITLSITQDSIDFHLLQKYMDTAITLKNIDLTYSFLHLKRDTRFSSYNPLKISTNSLKLASRSTLIPKGEGISLLFQKPDKTIYLRGLIGILLSFILSATTVFCLFYLLLIIKRQKHLSQIKNDFISNVTHELKTPIATVAIALEGISKFNTKNDPEKTKKYVDLSNQQLDKLNQIVEKILDTANLEHDQLEITREPADLVELLGKLIHRFELAYPDHHLTNKTAMASLEYELDIFHFENALNNVVDNACKYGNGQVEVELEKTNKAIELRIRDNGPGIPSSYRDQIFKKFFRIPKGNQHDVKGFGIGLYYALNIIEKHGGIIYLASTESWTTFVITLPLSS